MRTHVSRLPVLLAGIAAVAIFPGAAEAAPLEATDIGVIEIVADSAPSNAAALDIQLFRDAGGGAATDITGESCGPVEVSPESPLPSRRCAGLADGSYSVQILGAPADAWLPTPLLCASGDVVQNEFDSSRIRIDATTTEWSCTATASPPGVLIDLAPQQGDLSTVPVFDIEIVDENGTVVSDSCEIDDRLDASVPRRWCAPLTGEVYDVRPIGVPDGVEARARCGSVSAASVGRRSLITIEDELRLYRCISAEALPSLTLGIEWEGEFDIDPAWADAVTLELFDPAGVDVTSSCRRSDSLGQNVSDTRFECFGLEVGTYVADIDGLRDDFEVFDDCGEIEVAAESPGTVCLILVIYDTAVTTTTTTSAPVVNEGPGPVTGSLPETGRSSGDVLLGGIAFLGAGLALVMASRRRAISSR